ncbi:MFS transporter [Paraburkholderia sediminicola]|uniref:MFS transporter n=1 Tax=Paraburkholderia sediminicola TaxID=458836 RepID=UPI0038BD2379
MLEKASITTHDFFYLRHRRSARLSDSVFLTWLIGLRFLQGIGVGGEWGGAVLLSMESHTGKRRGFMASLPNVGVPLGLVISVLLCALIRPGEQAAFYMLTTFAVLYGSKHLALGRDLMLNAVLIAAVVACFAVPFFGYVADRIGRRRTYLSAAICMMLFAFPYFAMLNTRLPAAVIAGTVIVMIIHGALYGSQAAYIAESFPARIRHSGASLGYQGASIIAGGPAPLISLWLFQTFHSGYAVAAYLAVMSLCSACAAFFLGRPERAALPAGRPANVQVNA